MTNEVGEEGEGPPDQADHHKHMDYVQAVITRLANNSFLMKGWALTVAIAVLGYATANLDWRVALLGLLPPVCFWYLDSYFLHRERLFRLLFADVRVGNLGDFSMDYKGYDRKGKRREAFLSETLLYFYLPILVAAVVIIILAICGGPPTPPATPPTPRP